MRGQFIKRTATRHLIFMCVCCCCAFFLLHFGGSTANGCRGHTAESVRDNDNVFSLICIDTHHSAPAGAKQCERARHGRASLRYGIARFGSSCSPSLNRRIMKWCGYMRISLGGCSLGSISPTPRYFSRAYVRGSTILWLIARLWVYCARG